MMWRASAVVPNVAPLDGATRSLVLLAARIAAGTEGEVRSAIAEALAGGAPHVWVEELLLQSYLFAGFPRALNAAREWRRASGRAAPEADDGEDYVDHEEWRVRGERTCAMVYGAMYDRLRVNVRALHPALDTWMVVEGYGKVLSRPGLDLARRELCIVAVCAATEQDRQLHSHLHGAVHAGASPQAVEEVLAIVAPMVSADSNRRYRLLWERVREA
jgi:4-carboxymuconolactone decarboxylase